MATETLTNYRHKKFDQHKRMQESKFVPMCWIPIPNASNPQQSTEVYFPPEKKFKTEATAQNELPVKMELLDLNASTSPLYNANIATNPPKRRKVQSNGSIDKEIQIKIEPKSPSHGLLKTEKEEPSSSENEYAVQIKQELIELNTNVRKIPRDAYDEICKFRGNMVRKFPKKERSAKEQERRDKNTYACRRSRRVKKIEQVAVEEEYKGYKDTHLRLSEYAIRAAAYFKELMNRTEEEMSDIIVVD